MFYKITDENGNTVSINLENVASIRYVPGGRLGRTVFSSEEGKQIYFIEQSEEMHELLIQQIDNFIEDYREGRL